MELQAEDRAALGRTQIQFRGASAGLQQNTVRRALSCFPHLLGLM